MSVSPTESRGRVKGETPLWKGKRMKRKLLLMLLCAALYFSGDGTVTMLTDGTDWYIWQEPNYVDPQ